MSVGGGQIAENGAESAVASDNAAPEVNGTQEPPSADSLPTAWSAETLLKSQRSVLRRLQKVSRGGALQIETTLKPTIDAALSRAGLPVTSDASQPAVPVKGGLPSDLFPSVFAHWRSWCARQGLFSLPIQGAVVTIFLASNVPTANRKKTVFVLESLRRETAGHFARNKRPQFNLTWANKEAAMYDVVVDQAQWSLPSWRAIAELAPPKPAKAKPTTLAVTPTSAPAVASSSKTAVVPSTAGDPVASSSKSVPQPHPATRYFAPQQGLKTVTELPAKGPSPHLPSTSTATRTSTSTSTSMSSSHPPPKHLATAPKSVAPFPLSEKARGKQPAPHIACPPTSKRPMTIVPVEKVEKVRKRRRTKAEMQAERAAIAEDNEEAAFYASAKRLSTAITMLSVLRDPSWRPDASLTAISTAQPPPATVQVRTSRIPVSVFRDGSKGPVVAAAAFSVSSTGAPPAVSSHPYADYTPTTAPSAYSDHAPAPAPILPPNRRGSIPFSNLPLPAITSQPVPVLPPHSLFALTPRQLLPWPQAVQPLTQAIVDSTWAAVQQMMAQALHASSATNTPFPSIQAVIQRKTRSIDPWCPKAKSPADQVEAARAKEAAGGRTVRANGAKPSPRIPVVSMPELASRTGKTPLLGQIALPGAQSPSVESAPMTSRPSMSRSSTGPNVHPLAQVWAKGTVEQRQVARERLLGAKGRSSPRSDVLGLTSPRTNDVSSLPHASSLPTSLSTSAALPASSSDASSLAPQVVLTQVPSLPSAAPSAPPLVPLPSTIAAEPLAGSADLSTNSVAIAPDAVRLGAEPSTDGEHATTSLATEVPRKNSLMLDEGPSVDVEMVGPPGSTSEKQPDFAPKVLPSREEQSAVDKNKGKGKEKEKDRDRPPEAEMILTKEMARAKKEERKRLFAERGGVPLRFQLSNTPRRPFG